MQIDIGRANKIKFLTWACQSIDDVRCGTCLNRTRSICLVDMKREILSYCWAIEKCFVATDETMHVTLVGKGDGHGRCRVSRHLTRFCLAAYTIGSMAW